MLSKSSSNPEALTFFFLKHKILFGNCLKQKIPCQERPGGKWVPNKMEFQGNKSLKGHKREIAPLLFEQWLVTCIFLALLITESGFSSEFHTEHELHNHFIIKYLLATHISGQATTRNKSIHIHQGLNSLSSGGHTRRRILPNKGTESAVSKANEGVKE